MAVVVLRGGGGGGGSPGVNALDCEDDKIHKKRKIVFLNLDAM